MIKALIFDMDGTLVNSEVIGIKTFVQLLDKYKFHYEKDKVMEIVYKSHMTVLKEILQKNKTPYQKKIAEEFKNKYIKALRKVQLMPHAIEILETMNDKAIMILATFSDDRATKAILDNLDLNKYFDMITTRDTYNDQDKGKMINKILKKTRLKPEECILIEDSHYGIKNGKINKIFTIGVKHTYDDLKADANVNNLKDAEKIILDKIKGGTKNGK